MIHELKAVDAPQQFGAAFTRAKLPILGLLDARWPTGVFTCTPEGPSAHGPGLLALTESLVGPAAEQIAERREPGLRSTAPRAIAEGESRGGPMAVGGRRQHAIRDVSTASSTPQEKPSSGPRRGATRFLAHFGIRQTGSLRGQSCQDVLSKRLFTGMVISFRVRSNGATKERS